MVRGVANSRCFLVYLSQSYLTRWFCRLEATVARLLHKPLVVVFESDPRHGGASDYGSLVEQCCQGARYSEYKPWLLSTEAVPMARRAFHRAATVAEVARRVGLPAATTKAVSAPPPLLPRASSAPPSAEAAGSPAACADEVAGTGGEGGWAGSGPGSELELRDVVSSLAAENEELWQENDALWRAVRALQEDVRKLKGE